MHFKTFIDEGYYQAEKASTITDEVLRALRQYKTMKISVSTKQAKFVLGELTTAASRGNLKLKHIGKSTEKGAEIHRFSYGVDAVVEVIFGRGSLKPALSSQINVIQHVDEGFMENVNFNRVMRTLSSNGYEAWGLTKVEAAELIHKLQGYMTYAGPDKIRARLGGELGAAIDALHKQMGTKHPSLVYSRHTFFSKNGKMEVVVSDQPFDDWPCTVVVSEVVSGK